jgi:hypothetical protein
MMFFRRLGLGLATSLFSFLLIVFALFASVFFVLDNPGTLKTALSQSGIYNVAVSLTAQKQQGLGLALPLDNPEVKQALTSALPASYIQATSERNIDSTYDWIHGRVQKPTYVADVSQPKNAFANNISTLVEQKFSALPVCTKLIAIPTTAAEVLNLTCRPAGIPASLVAAAAQLQIAQSGVIDTVATSATTLQDNNGQSLTDKLSYVPKAHRYYIISLYVIPFLLLLSGTAIFFWSQSRRSALKVMARMLLVTGLLSIIFSLVAVWALGQGVHYLENSTTILAAVQGKLLDVANILGTHLRNWWIGIGAGYIVAAVTLMVLLKVKGARNTQQNEHLNAELGYNANIPSAGTTFDPHANKPPSDRPE